VSLPVVLVMYPPCLSCGNVHDGALTARDRRVHGSIQLALKHGADPAHIVVAASEMSAELTRLIGRTGA
jgi:hypothetical protein